MEAIFDHNGLWKSAREDRRRQKFLGRISSIFLGIALIALFDGLLAQMRAGSNELDMLAGSSITLSGPAALKNPVSSDLSARLEPQTSPISFVLDGFYSGYWFGNGMWRGDVSAPRDTPEGQYTLTISFRGASAQTAQRYILRVFADPESMRAASLSYFRRWLNLNPFIVAAACGGLGILLGLATYFFGRRYAISLMALGLAQVFRFQEEDGGIWCLTPEASAPREGAPCLVLDEDGQPLGQARAGKWHKGRLRLQAPEGAPLEAVALVRMKNVPADNFNSQAQSK